MATVRRVTCDPSVLVMKVGETRRVLAKAFDAADNRVTGRAGAINFASTRPDLLDVVPMATGAADVTALAPGAAVIDATAGRASGHVAVTITAPAPVPVPVPAPVETSTAPIVVTPAVLALQVGDVAALAASGTAVAGANVYFTVSDPAVLQVEPWIGRVTALRDGIARVFATVQAAGYPQTSVRVTVGDAAAAPPPPAPAPVVAVGPRTLVVQPGAPAGGDGSEGAPLGSLDALHATPHAHATVVLRGGTYPAGQSLRVQGGAQDAPTRYVVPSGERAILHGGTDPNGPMALYGQGARFFAVQGDLRIRPDPRVPQQIRRFMFDRCSDFALDGVKVLGDYRPGDATAAGSMGDSTLWACERFTLDRGTTDVIGDTPDTAGNGGDGLFIARGCRDGKIRHWTLGRAGHVGATVIGGEILDGVAAPATERIVFTDLLIENTWTGGLNFNGATADCEVAGFVGRGLGRDKANALSRGGLLITGDGHHIHDGRLEDVAGTALQVQAYPFRGLLQHSRGHRLERITGARIGGAALVLRVKGVNNDPPSAPDFDCDLSGITVEGLDFVACCLAGTEDAGRFFGASFPVFLDYYHASDEAWARATAGGAYGAPGSVVRNSRFTAPGPVGTLFVIGKQGSPNRAYATAADVAVAFPGWTGIVVEPTTVTRAA